MTVDPENSALCSTDMETVDNDNDFKPRNVTDMHRRDMLSGQKEMVPANGANDTMVAKTADSTEGVQKVEVESEPLNHILYGISDNPPILATCVFAIQVATQVVSYAVSNAILVADAICGSTHVAAKLMSTNMFLAGLTTFLQSLLGIRLPVFQSPAVYFLVPVLARAELPDWSCESPKPGFVGNASVSLTNGTSMEPEDDLWREKLLEISGVLMIVSAIHAMLGATGLCGQITKFIGPLTIAPSIIVMILKVVESIIKFSLVHLGVAAFTFVILLILTTYMANVLVPIPWWTKPRGWHLSKSRFLKTYAVLISIGLGWLLCHILTIAGALPDDPNELQWEARTDNKGDTIELARWFYVPYPGQFGMPRFSLTLFFGLLIAMISSVIDSLADYNIVSRLCELPQPPLHATNRGILIEGGCSILSGAFGAGLATSTFLAVTGSLHITGVTSRRVFQVSGILMMLLGVVGKIGAFFVIIPKPVIGAVMVVIMASVVGILLAELNDLEMKRPRNFMTIGLGLLLGYMVPKLIVNNQQLINTGIPDVDNMIIAMLGMPLFVAGVTACFLDNTLPGSRGQNVGPNDLAVEKLSEGCKGHRLPFLHDYFRKSKWTRYCPFLPSFQEKQNNSDQSGEEGKDLTTRL